MPSTLGGLKVHLHRVTKERSMEAWHILGKATMPAELDPVLVSEAILSGHAQVFLCTKPRIWFICSFMRDHIIPSWRVMHVMCGFAEEKIDKIFCSELLENLEACAKATNNNALLFNDQCAFLNKFLAHANYDSYWIRIEEDSDG